MKPIIGVMLRSVKIGDSNALYLSEKVRRGIIQSGGEVFTLTPPQDVNYIETKGKDLKELTEEEKNIIEKQLTQIDGLFIPGGSKFSEYDRYVLKKVIEKKIPTLGVCLGMQLMSCYEEEVILENAPIEKTNHQSIDPNEKYNHLVKIQKNSKLFKIIGKEEILVNSFHSKMATNNNIYKVVATSEDKCIEAMEYPGDFFNIGVQWHPEFMVKYDENAKKLMEYFVNEAKLNKIKEKLLTNIK